MKMNFIFVIEALPLAETHALREALSRAGP
jgi:hypothetical protein